MFPQRYSPVPKKQLLWLWLARDMKSLRGQRGLDAACGIMTNKRFFQTDTYLGIDNHAGRMATALEQNPDADGRLLAIEDLTPEEHASDVVLCVQTIGVNKRFDNDRPLNAVKKLVAVTKPGGALVLNVGMKTAHDGILDALKSSFESVEVTKAPGWPWGRSWPLPVSLLLAYLLYFIPALRRGGGIYCVCRNRLHGVSAGPATISYALAG